MNQNYSDHRLPSQRGRILLVLGVLLTLSAFVFAQSQDQDKDKDNGKVFGGYVTHQTIEFGGRIDSIHGNTNLYNDFVNLHSGARLLDYTLNMHSMTHTGMLFDDLSFTNGGYGGDPNDVSRLRVQKNKWYDFTAQFRRDVNFYDYNAFSNPLNYGPTAAVPNRPTTIQWNDSIHMFNTRRKMGDFNLVLAPQSPIRVRLGWSRYDNRGPSGSSYHEGTDVQLLQNFSARQDTYNAGVDVKLAPRTTISYDQFITRGKNNTWYTDANVGTGGFFLNVAGTPRPFDPGADFYPYYGQPCTGVAISAAGVVTQSGTAPNGCQGYAGYIRTQPQRMDLMTEQLSVRSNYFKKLDITASGTYSSATNKIDNFFENAQYWVSRTNVIGGRFTGPTKARRFDGGADLGFTYHINDAVSISNLTKFQNWREPGTFDLSTTLCYPSVASSNAAFVGPFTPANASNPACAAITGTPVAATSLITATLGADQSSQRFSRYLAERTIQNTSLLEWSPSTHFSGHLGYRYRLLNLNLGEFDSAISSTFLGAPVGARPGNGTVVVTGTDLSDAPAEKEDATEHTLLAGFSARPVHNWNITGDFEWTYSNHQFTPISPGHMQQSKVRSTYRFAKWGSINGSLNWREGRNGLVPLNEAFGDTGVVANAFPAGDIEPVHKDHNRSVAFGTTLTPIKNVVLDFGYTWNDFLTHGGTCMMVSGSAASPLIPNGGNLTRCLNVTDPFNSTAGIGQAIPSILNYQQTTNTGYINLSFKPVHRLTVNMGYDLTADSGYNSWLRADTGAPLLFPVDQVGNVIITSTGGVPTPAAGSGQVLSGYASGPNPLQPQGTLAMSWHKPSAGVEVELTKAVSFKGQWNYYDYNEHGGQAANANGLLAPRDFHANVGTVSLKYSF